MFEANLKPTLFFFLSFFLLLRRFVKIKHIVLFKCQDILGRAWACLGVLGHAWACLGVLGRAWVCLGVLGRVNV